MSLKEPFGGLALLLHQLRSGRVSWLADRLHREWTLPTTASGRAVYRFWHPSRWFERLPKGTTPQEDCLIAFYDLAVAPVTFDFLWFLVGADLERRRAGLTNIHIVIVPGLENGLRRERPDYEAIVDAAARRARIAGILLPACAFLPASLGVTIASSRAEAAEITRRARGRTFPHGYEPALPIYPGPHACLEAGRRGEKIAVLRAPSHDLRVAQSWLATHAAGRLPVTITLRQYQYMPDRNSNLPAWLAFARRLDRDRFFPVFIPDTDQVFQSGMEPLTEFSSCNEAAWNLGMRFGLYEAAYVNLGVNNGPMGLCWLNDRTRYLTFKILSDSVPQTTTEYMRHLGFDLNRSLPFATRLQKWVWEDDTLEIIEREFSEFVRQTDALGNQVSA